MACSKTVLGADMAEGIKGGDRGTDRPVEIQFQKILLKQQKLPR